MISVWRINQLAINITANRDSLINFLINFEFKNHVLISKVQNLILELEKPIYNYTAWDLFHLTKSTVLKFLGSLTSFAVLFVKLSRGV